MTGQEYVDGRLKQYQGWYDKKAVFCKSRYMAMRGSSVVLGALVPVLVNLQFAFVSYLTTFASLIVVVFVSLESVYHYREQWKNYRSTEQYLGHEAIYYTSRIGPYKGMDDQAAFETLVDRVEN